jgi:hypothetical protein
MIVWLMKNAGFVTKINQLILFRRIIAPVDTQKTCKYTVHVERRGLLLLMTLIKAGCTYTYSFTLQSQLCRVTSYIYFKLHHS